MGSMTRNDRVWLQYHSNVYENGNSAIKTDPSGFWAFGWKALGTLTLVILLDNSKHKLFVSQMKV